MKPLLDSSPLRAIPAALFNLVYPAECRVCSAPLSTASRIPVCEACLSAPQPFVAEHFCSNCQAPFVNSAPLDENGLCSLCRRGLAGYDLVLSYGEYDGVLRKLIHLFKYGKVYPLASKLGALLSRALPRHLHFDVIVPMPLHWRRRWQRGFNQSELLARAVSKRTGVPVSKAVGRRKSTPPQAGLTSAERRLNVSGAFEVKKRKSLEGKHVLLIDDVLTTGATASSCAAALKRSGAAQVTVLTLARVDRRRGISRTSVL